jgi:hypothetical protein
MKRRMIALRETEQDDVFAVIVLFLVYQFPF